MSARGVALLQLCCGCVGCPEQDTVISTGAVLEEEEEEDACTGSSSCALSALT